MIKNEIKPCPFCGGECRTDWYRCGDRSFYNVICQCGYVSMSRPPEQGAIAAHNRLSELAGFARKMSRRLWAANREKAGLDCVKCTACMECMENSSRKPRK